MAVGELLEANINRSPTAYLENPQGERVQYAYNIDKDMTLVKFEDEEDRSVGRQAVIFMIICDHSDRICPVCITAPDTRADQFDQPTIRSCCADRLIRAPCAAWLTCIWNMSLMPPTARVWARSPGSWTAHLHNCTKTRH